jgi:hypothetical protein
VYRRLTEEELGEPEAEALLSDAARTVKEQRRWERARSHGARERGAELRVPPDRV